MTCPYIYLGPSSYDLKIKKLKMRENELTFPFYSISTRELIKSEFMVASSKPMYDSIRLKLVSVSSGAPRLFDAVQDGVTVPSNSADNIGLNKKQTVAILYQLCYGLSQKCNWFECDDAVVLKDYHPNQQG